MKDVWVVIGHGSSCLALARDQTGASDHDPDQEVVWSLRAKLQDDGLIAVTRVFLGPEGVEKRLDDFFARLAADWRGWDGVRVWDGMEGGLVLTCTHNGRGTVVVDLLLRHLSGAGWTAKAQVLIDAGEEMANLVRDLRALLAP